MSRGEGFAKAKPHINIYFLTELGAAPLATELKTLYSTPSTLLSNTKPHPFSSKSTAVFSRRRYGRFITKQGEECELV